MSKNNRTQIAVYPGTFDPITNGHLDILTRAQKLFDQVIVAVAPNPKKTPLFPADERLAMAREATSGLPHVTVDLFDGLLVDYLEKKRAIAIIRGIRAFSDFELEFQMALMNRKLNPKIETLFLIPSEEYSYLTSTLIKEIAGYGGDIANFVPKGVLLRLQKRFQKGQK